jgi:hypothetical protein
MVAGWVRQHITPGGWILDPLCSTPQLPLEAARAGYRVLAACNNPILAFLIQEMANAPAQADFKAALAELGAARRGEERLEIHFRNLYQTECANCRQMIQPQAYIWRRGENQPYARVYHCPHCGDDGERPVTPGDLAHMTLPGSANLHLARALERVAPAGDPLREGAQEISQFFVPRALYVLTTFINRIEGLTLPESKRRLLVALALSACDDANCLWPYPEARSRPRQLTMPPVFREKNLWMSLEAAIETWSVPRSPVPLTLWPALPPESGGICLYAGRIKSILPLTESIVPQATVAVLPRPSQAFWSLSAIWSGWLWGREAVAPLRNALERQRYDWYWHAQALRSIFAPLAQTISRDVPIWAILPELVPGFLSAAVLAAEAANLHMEGLALQAEDELAQIHWRVAPSPRPDASNRAIEPLIHQAVRDQLLQLHEPASYLNLHAAGLEALANEFVLPPGSQAINSETLTRLQNSFSKVFKSPAFHRFDRQSSVNIETGWWWLSKPPLTEELPLADRAEMELVRWLIKNPKRRLDEIETALCAAFPGLITPSSSLIQMILESYAAPSESGPPLWQIRPGEAPAKRREDLSAIRRGLERLGKKLGYVSKGEEPPLTWMSNDEPAYLLVPQASAVISRYLLHPQSMAPERCILVVPGSRVNLILYKLRRDPRLAEAMASGWRLMKFRQLREMLDQPELNPGEFESLLNGDPARWEEATQLAML